MVFKIFKLLFSGLKKGPVKTLIKRVVPIIGPAVGFAETALEVYNSTTYSGAVVTATKGLLINCTPPVIKYPVLCATLFCCGAGCLVTSGHPMMISVTVMVADVIVQQGSEEFLGE